MKELLERYKLLNEEQKARIFNEEQRNCLDRLVFFDKLFTDTAFYKAVETAIAEEAYEFLRAQE